MRPLDSGPARFSTTPGLDPEAVPTVLMPAIRPTSPRAEAENAPPASVRPMGVVAGSGPKLSEEIDALKQMRLRAACEFFLVAVALFLAWRLLFTSERYLWPLNVAVMAALAWLLVKLSVPQGLPPRRLAPS